MLFQVFVALGASVCVCLEMQLLMNQLLVTGASIKKPAIELHFSQTLSVAKGLISSTPVRDLGKMCS